MGRYTGPWPVGPVGPWYWVPVLPVSLGAVLLIVGLVLTVLGVQYHEYCSYSTGYSTLSTVNCTDTATSSTIITEINCNNSDDH